MKQRILLIVALLAILILGIVLPTTAQEADLGDTLGAVQDAGILNCGVSGALLAFSYVDADGNMAGFDADYCRAVAAAVWGDAAAGGFRSS
nr:amino acid ABC transporter substrate-binding protein [Chloroflexota bacterium]